MKALATLQEIIELEGPGTIAGVHHRTSDRDQRRADPAGRVLRRAFARSADVGTAFC